jgi:polar amino acid transport system ATP-binding protein
VNHTNPLQKGDLPVPHLEVTDLVASYGGGARVLDGVSFTVDKGEIVSVIGPSGSGKSTLLRVIMGLTPPSGGAVKVDGEAIDYHRKASLRHLRERLAIVFQQFNLFQNMDALRNVTITPTKIRGRDRRQVEEEATALLTKVGLGEKLAAYPDQLSGGQQQRVAIARALALKPEILLLDEVTSALDPELVNEVLDAIRTLAGDGMTMLVVSHEMGFVREISSRVIMMDKGRIVEAGSPRQIFDEPQTVRCRDFVGKVLRH